MDAKRSKKGASGPMCRLAAYCGVPIPLGDIIYAAPHGLERQAYSPGEMVSGRGNGDSTGIAWWQADDPRPTRYLTARPPWADTNLPALAGRVRGAPQLAVVSSQNPGMGAGLEAAHPFLHGEIAGAHNGYLGGSELMAPALVGAIDASLLARPGTVTDSRSLFLYVAGLIERGAGLAEALTEVAAAAARACGAGGAVASLNLVLATRDEVVALRCARGVAPNSLYVLEGGARWPDGVVLASEPLDDDAGWRPIAEDRCLRVSADGVRDDALCL